MKKSVKTERSQVMVCVLKSHRDKDVLLKEKWYRIPLAHVPRRRPKYLAFYQPAIFGKSGKRIELYGQVKCWRVKKRIDLLPKEVNHANSQEPYIQFILSKVSKLHHPLTNYKGLRVCFGFTSLSKLRRSPDLRRLFDIPPIEDILAKILNENNIPFCRQYTVKGKANKFFRLDFAIPRQKQWLDVECDGFRWHSQKRQREADRKRDCKLKALGWTVLRIPEEELIKNPTEVLGKIKEIL